MSTVRSAEKSEIPHLLEISLFAANLANSVGRLFAKCAVKCSEVPLCRKAAQTL